MQLNDQTYSEDLIEELSEGSGYYTVTFVVPSLKAELRQVSSGETNLKLDIAAGTIVYFSTTSLVVSRLESYNCGS